jgi:hypothetical protein
MNTGQMMMTAMAMILLGTTIFAVNSNNLQYGTIFRQTELGIYAVSLGTSIIQRASGVFFDEKTEAASSVPSTINPTVGVLSTTLGRESGVANLVGPTEWANKDTSFDDFDDYNNYSLDSTITGVDRFRISAVVYYVSQTPPYTKVAGPTWLKQIDISVNNTISRDVFQNRGAASDQGKDTVKMSYIFSFY